MISKIKHLGLAILNFDPTILGVPFQSVLLPIGVLGYILLEQDYIGLQQYGLSFLLTVTATQGLKFLVQRQRPDQSDTLSFPSGHTSSAFSAAAFIHHRYGLQQALPAYLLSTTIGGIRIYKEAHYSTDVAVGAGLAILTSYQICSQSKLADELSPVLYSGLNAASNLSSSLSK